MTFDSPEIPQTQPSLPMEQIAGNLPVPQMPKVGRTILLKVIDDTTVVTTGDGKLIWAVPAALDGSRIYDVAAFVTTVSSSGTPTIQLRNATDTTDLLTTKITIDANEYTSYTAATPRVIDTTKHYLKRGDLWAVDVDVAGTGAKGLGIIIETQ